MRKVTGICFLLLIACCILQTGCGAAEKSEEKSRQDKEVMSDKVSEKSKENSNEGSNSGEKLRFIDAWGEWHEMEVNPRIKTHDYNWSYLTNAEGEVQYTGDERYTIRRGVDVSRHQGEVDWQKVKKSGYDFAFLRIGYREYGTNGILHVDESFHTNIVNAQQAGIDVGVYLFSQAVSEEEAYEEAELVLDNLAGYELQLPVVYDPERIRDDTARTDDVTGEQFTNNTVAFCKKMEEAGYQPMVYSNLVWEAFEYNMEELKNYPVWYADYEPVPQTPYYFTYWQYSEKGKVDGINGDVDVNVQFISNK